MIAVSEFAKGMALLAAQLRHPLAPVEVEAFHLALGDETDEGEWMQFARVAVKRNGWKFLPGVVDILDALREFRGSTPLALEAAEAYARVLASSVYLPQAGGVWTREAVLATCGEAAAAAFEASGGDEAWSVTFGEAKRRERFVASYTRAVRENPAVALLPEAPSRPLLEDQGQDHEGA